MKKLTSYHLKIIAIGFMMLDHVLKAFSNDIMTWMQNNQIFTFTNYIIFMVILSLGRIAFPLFTYMIAQGCEHTHNIKKYIYRLLLLAVISEVPFQYFMSILNETPYTFSLSAGNVFFTLALGAISIEGYRRLKEKKASSWIPYSPVIICAVLAQVLDTDYAGIGVILIFLWFIFKDSKYWYLPVIIFSVFLYDIFFLTLGIINYGFDMFVILEAVLHTSCSLLSILILKRYNGKKGKPIKWFFYVFYPLHITLIVMSYNFLH
ncbi:MAG: TraX family protein [Coprobacillus sp.]